MTTKKKKRSVGRPRRSNRDELLEKFKLYIKNTEIPIAKEFCVDNDVLYTTLWEWDEFKETIKKCSQKKEAKLERAALENRINHGMAIFSLKQLGWKDSKVMELHGSVIEKYGQIADALKPADPDPV